jgi:hypothetical protein
LKKKGLHGLMGRMGLLFLGISILFLPITAELFAFYKMINLFGWTWWIILALLTLLLMTCIIQVLEGN